MAKYLLSTIMGVESLARKEIERQGGKVDAVFDRMVIFSGGEELIARINLWSRVGNKLYLILNEAENVIDFDSVFESVSSVDWKKYFKKSFPMRVNATSVRSDLHSIPSLQSVAQKGIIHVLTDGSMELVREDDSLETIDILILIIDNTLRILLNTSGQALHMRGYRKNTGEAPIKESLAAALVLLSNWRFKENFYDPFCGSGTIPIEAAMIAKNIAPGLQRSFAFEGLCLLDEQVINNEKTNAKNKQFQGVYNIYASDIDDEIIEIAKSNAQNAGVASMIHFSQKDFTDLFKNHISGILVSNPPYGLRLKDKDLSGLYNKIDQLFRMNSKLKGGIISSYLSFDRCIHSQDYKKRKLYNAAQMCYFWRKL